MFCVAAAVVEQHSVPEKLFSVWKIVMDSLIIWEALPDILQVFRETGKGHRKHKSTLVLYTVLLSDVFNFLFHLWGFNFNLNIFVNNFWVKCVLNLVLIIINIVICNWFYNTAQKPLKHCFDDNLLYLLVVVLYLRSPKLLTKHNKETTIGYILKG